MRIRYREGIFRFLFDFLRRRSLQRKGFLRGTEIVLGDDLPVDGNRLLEVRIRLLF